MRRLDTIENSIPSIDNINEIDKRVLGSINMLDGSINNITTRIKTLESIKIKNDQPARTDKLEVSD